MLLFIIVFAVACAATGCDRSPRVVQRSSGRVPFGELAILPTVEFINAPTVILASARDFYMLCDEADADRVLGRMDPDTGIWIEFALIFDGAFYVLPAQGYHTPVDRFEGEQLEMPDAASYYEIKRRDDPGYQFRSYFVE